jgi:hypothetical protein
MLTPRIEPLSNGLHVFTLVTELSSNLESDPIRSTCISRQTEYFENAPICNQSMKPRQS